MSAAVLPLFRSQNESPQLRDGDGGKAWQLAELQGRLCELSADRSGAQLTAAFGLIVDAQRQSEPAAIVMTRTSTFYPPDLEGSGVDLDALVVVRVPEEADVVRAAEQLVRSGAFGLVVCDLGARARIPMPLLSRLSGLVRKHVTAVTFLTEKDEDSPSLGSLVSLRAQVERVREDEGVFSVAIRVLKDKRRAPGWGFAEVCRGPAGVR